MRTAPLLLLTVMALAGAGANAEESAAVPEPPGLAELTRFFEIHGFLLGTTSIRTTGLRPSNGEGGDFVLGEGRVRLDVNGATESGDALLLVKGDLLYDAIERDFSVDLREAYGGYTWGPLDLHSGRQIITWGVGDLFFISDVFPKDWDSFFSGRPMEYLKLGVDALRGRYSSEFLNVEALWIPLFTPDVLPPADRFFFFDPFSAVPTQEEEPTRRLSNPELALRLYRRVMDADLSVYVYRGFWRLPRGARVDDVGMPTVVTRFFPKLSVYSASAQRSFGEGVLSLEAGYYDSRQDRDGDDPAIPNSQWRFLAGYQRQLWEDFTAGFQTYSEIIDDYSAYRDSLPAGIPAQDRLQEVLSVRLTQLLAYQTWKLSLFAAYGVTDDDYFIQPEVSWRVTDRLGLSIGSNVFGGGSSATAFGQFEKNDNVFVNTRFDF